MSEIEFIDLFAEEPVRTPEARESFEANPFYSQSTAEETSEIQTEKPRSRMRLNDYKHQAHHLSKGNTEESFSINSQDTVYSKENGNQGDRSFKINDEKMVWAGALFVFFGVFVFIFGYWLGNMTVSKMKVDHSRYETQIKQKLAEKRLENRAINPLNPVREPQTLISKPTEERGIAASVVVHQIPVEKKMPIEDVIRPRKSVTVKAKVASKSVKIAKSKTTAKSVVAPKPGSVSDSANYTIQVSAYTRMDKARALEDLLRNKGLQAYIVESMVNGTRYFRVRVGKFSGKSSASGALKKVKQQSIAKDSYLIRLK